MAISDVFKNAAGWVKTHPAYSIGGAGGAVFVGYLFYKQNQSKSTASGASGTQPTSATSQFASGDLNATPSYDYLYGFYTGDQQGGTSGGSSSGGTSGTSGQNVMVRAQSNTPWDQKNAGVPLRDAPAGNGNILAYVPWGSPVNVSGAVHTGKPNTQGGSPNWYPVNYGGQTGYISALDLVGIGIGRAVSSFQKMMSHHDLWSTPDTWVSGAMMN